MTPKSNNGWRKWALGIVTGVLIMVGGWIFNEVIYGGTKDVGHRVDIIKSTVDSLSMVHAKDILTMNATMSLAIEGARRDNRERMVIDSVILEGQKENSKLLKKILTKMDSLGG